MGRKSNSGNEEAVGDYRYEEALGFLSRRAGRLGETLEST